MDRSALLAAALLTGSVSLSTAQSHDHHPLVGVWSITFPAGSRIENGTPTVITGTGRLRVEASGDSLVARLQADPVEGRPARPEARFAAKAGGDEVVFTQRSSVSININGESREATAISTWTLTAKGDKLEGTLARRVGGAEIPAQAPQPVTGSRVKG